MRPTKQQVWEVVMQNSDFLKNMPVDSPERDVMRPFIEGSVDALSGLLDTPVSVLTLADATARFLRYCVAGNLREKLATAGTRIDELNDLFIHSVTNLEQIVADVPAFLKKEGVTEEEFLTGRRGGLNPENQEKWQKGTLTIGELLCTQPECVILPREQNS
jgi:hypothetical protein